eukprot:g77618.t1
MWPAIALRACRRLQSPSSAGPCLFSSSGDDQTRIVLFCESNVTARSQIASCFMFYTRFQTQDEFPFTAYIACTLRITSGWCALWSGTFCNARKWLRTTAINVNAVRWKKNDMVMERDSTVLNCNQCSRVNTVLLILVLYEYHSMWYDAKLYRQYLTVSGLCMTVITSP